MSELRESMWDLVYGLLSEEESQALIARIKSEPDAARLYAEVRLEADLVARAARVEDSSIALKADEDAAAGQKTAKAMPTLARGGSARSGTDFHRGAAWLAGIAATALAVFLAVGFCWQRASAPQLARTLVAADVTAAQPMRAGLTCPVDLRTYLVKANGEPADGAPANVELRLLDSAGNPRFNKVVQTNEIGRATCDLPGESLEPGVRLEIAASKQSQIVAAARRDQVSQREEANANNALVASVELPVQPEPQIAYFLCASPVQQPDQQVPFAEWYFNAFTAKPAPPETGQHANLAVQGVTVYEARPPAAPSAAAVANGTLQYQNFERANQYRALNDRVAAGEATKDLKSQLDFKSQAVVPADQPIAVAVPEQLEGKPLKVAAMNRGVNIATQVVNSAPTRERRGRSPAAPGKKAESASEQLSLALPPEADGLVEVQLFDQSKSQEEPVDRQYVVRQPTRRLRIDVPDAKARYSPGEQVALTVRCTDENGKAAADTRLGVRVWNEMAIQQSGEEPVLLADAVDHGLGEVVQNAVAPAQQVAEPTSQLGQLGLQVAAERVVGQPIELATNREQVKFALRSAAESAATARQRTISVFGGAAVVGGIAVLLLLTMLLVLRLSVGWRAMAPGFVVAIASVLIGLGWIGWWPADRFEDDVAMATATHGEPAASVLADNSAATEAKQLDGAPLEPSTRERDEKTRTAAEVAPALASTPTPTPAAAPRPTAPIAGPQVPAMRERIAAKSQSAAAIPPVAQKFEQTRVPIVTLQVPGGQQARAFNLEKDSEVESVNRRAAGVAGGLGSFGGGRAIAGPSAGVAAEQLKRKSDTDDARKERLAEGAAAKPQSAAAPSSLYFNPQLMTDSDGKATIQFTMPQADSEYRVLVDALGQGRIGSQQQTIICGNAPSK
jgi:hypothetical protein